MPYSIRKVGSQYCLYLKDSGKKIGCHATKAKAEAQRAAIEARKHASRHLTMRGAVGEIRTAEFDGKPRMIVPVVALVEGVIWPINAPEPEFVPADTLAAVPGGWNGRPVFADAGHPTNADGVQVSGNTPRLLESAIGTVFNAKTDGKRLLMEAWLDPEKDGAKKILDRIAQGQTVEVSVGAFVIVEPVPGMYNGKPYDNIWREIIPDHLALLPEGDEGACSASMGCGIRAAQYRVHLVMNEEGQVDVPQTAEDYMRMMESLGPEFLQAHLFTHCMNTIIPAIEQKGGHVSDPNAFCGWWKEENSMAHPNPSPRAMKRFESLVQSSLAEDLKADPLKEIHLVGDGVFVYETASGKMYRQGFEIKSCGSTSMAKERVEVEPIVYYEPIDLTAAKGARHSASDMAKIQAMHDHSVDLGAQCAPKAMAAKPCGCQKAKETAMTRTKEQRAELIKTLRTKIKADVVTKLEALAKSSGDILDAIVAQIKDKLGLSDAAAADIQNLDEATLVELAGLSMPAAPGDGENKDGNKDGQKPPTDSNMMPGYTTNAGKPLTEEQFLAIAPESVKTLVANAKAQEAAHKGELIKVLKGAQTEFTEAELQAQSVKELERLVRALKANVPAQVFFGVNEPRVPESAPENSAPAPIDWTERVKAAQAKK